MLLGLSSPKLKDSSREFPGSNAAPKLDESVRKSAKPTTPSRSKSEAKSKPDSPNAALNRKKSSNAISASPVTSPGSTISRTNRSGRTVPSSRSRNAAELVMPMNSAPMVRGKDHSATKPSADTKTSEPNVPSKMPNGERTSSVPSASADTGSVKRSLSLSIPE